MTAIQKMVEFLNTDETMMNSDDADTVWQKAIDESRRLAEIEAREKPQADASLVEEIMSYIVQCESHESMPTCSMLYRICSKYHPVQQTDIVGALTEYYVSPSPWKNNSAEYADGMHDAKRAIEEIIRNFESEKGGK